MPALTRNEIIEGIFNDKQYINYCRQVCGAGDLFQDLFQYVILYLMEMPEDKLIKLNESGGLRMYVARIIYINANSASSQFYKQYRSDTFEINAMQIEAEAENSAFENWMNKFDDELKKECNKCINNGVYPAQVKLYEIYEEKKSYTKVAKCTQIPYKTVQRNIKSLREKIIKKVNENID